MRILLVWLGALAGCSAVTHFDTGFLPESHDAGVGVDAAADGGPGGDAGLGFDAGVEQPACRVVGGPTALDATAPLGGFPAVAAFEDDLAVAYVGPLPAPDDDGYARAQVRLGSCDALDGPTLMLDVEGGASEDRTPTDAAWNDEQQAFGVVWSDGSENTFAKWNTVRRVDGVPRVGAERFPIPTDYDATYDLRWPRVSVTGGEFVIFLPDAGDPERRVTVYHFPLDPWPPNLGVETFAWPGRDLIVAGSSDVVGRADVAEYHFSSAVDSPPVLYVADYRIGPESVRGSEPLLQGVATSRLAVIDDTLPAYWTSRDATTTAVVVQDQDGTLRLLYPDLSDLPEAIDGATATLAFDVVGLDARAVTAWLEPVEQTTEVRVSVADLRDGEIASQSRSVTLYDSETRGWQGISAAVLADGQHVALAWAEPDATRFTRVRVACMVCDGL